MSTANYYNPVFTDTDGNAQNALWLQRDHEASNIYVMTQTSVGSQKCGVAKFDLNNNLVASAFLDAGTGGPGIIDSFGTPPWFAIAPRGTLLFSSFHETGSPFLNRCYLLDRNTLAPIANCNAPNSTGQAFDNTIRVAIAPNEGVAFALGYFLGSIGDAPFLLYDTVANSAVVNLFSLLGAGNLPSGQPTDAAFDYRNQPWIGTVTGNIHRYTYSSSTLIKKVETHNPRGSSVAIVKITPRLTEKSLIIWYVDGVVLRWSIPDAAIIPGSQFTMSWGMDDPIFWLDMAQTSDAAIFTAWRNQSTGFELFSLVNVTAGIETIVPRSDFPDTPTNYSGQATYDTAFKHIWDWKSLGYEILDYSLAPPPPPPGGKTSYVKIWGEWT